jgi:hypothetical protein
MNQAAGILSGGSADRSQGSVRFVSGWLAAYWRGGRR